LHWLLRRIVLPYSQIQAEVFPQDLLKMNGGGTFKVPELPLNKRKQPPTGSSSSSTSSFNELLPPPTSNKRVKTDHSSNGKTSDPLANPSRISSGAHSSVSSSKSGPAAPDPLSQYSRAARVEDEPEPSSSTSRGMEVEEEDDDAYGPADETFEADDGDEEGGRFFGGGTNETQEVRSCAWIRMGLV